MSLPRTALSLQTKALRPFEAPGSSRQCHTTEDLKPHVYLKYIPVKKQLYSINYIRSDMFRRQESL